MAALGRAVSLVSQSPGCPLDSWTGTLSYGPVFHTGGYNRDTDWPAVFARRRTGNGPVHDFRFRRLPGEDLNPRVWAVSPFLGEVARRPFWRADKEGVAAPVLGTYIPKLSPVGWRGIRCQWIPLLFNHSVLPGAFKHLDTILFYQSHSGSLYLYPLLKVPHFSHSSCLPLKKDLFRPPFS